VTLAPDYWILFNILTQDIKYSIMVRLFIIINGLLYGTFLFAQHEHHQHQMDGQLPIINSVEAQPLMAQAIRLDEALAFVGNPLPDALSGLLKELQKKAYDLKTVTSVQELLDPLCLAFVQINPESRVKVAQGMATPLLMQDGWSSFLIKVHNEAHITAELVPESINAHPVLHKSTGSHHMKPMNEITPGEIDNQFAELAIYQGRPLKKNLSGVEVEYFILQIYTRAKGKREIELGFNVGQGTQDIGFRNTIDILFDILPAVKVKFHILDTDGAPAMASFIITDGKERFGTGDETSKSDDYRITMASRQHWQEGLGDGEYHLSPEKQLRGVFPLPSRRLAGKDDFPDFFFQPQIYRFDGEYIYLPPGEYFVEYGRGPEYLTKHGKIQVPPGLDSMEIDFQLERWIQMTALGWYSADHHIHAAGCSHYESPAEGVLPEHMWRQVLGEDLNMGNNLTWGPSWYFQKQFFTGDNYELSNADNIMRYDVEVSGFPSSHAGHIVLLNLKEDDYPNTTLIEEWPSWTLPVLSWAKGQGGITGYAHSGWGLAPVTPTPDLPNYIMPKMDGIGANEFVVTVTHDLIDFYSAGDTPLPAELNMWYHILNAGFKTRISGETDFPCISDERVGRARIYAQLNDGLDFSEYMQALVQGRSYVSEGHAHLIDFQVDQLKLGENGSLLKLNKPGKVDISINAAAFLETEQDEAGKIIASLNPYQSPYWHIERSRVGKSREVIVELLENGVPVAEKSILANGDWNKLTFSHQLEKSAWLAARIKYAAHTNPVFVEVDAKPIRVRKSIEWCRAAVDQCWEQKNSRFRPEEIDAAKAGYEHARSLRTAFKGSRSID
ncbi:MAG: CehA/McbA family metallohydrolase, partial [Saprospiraceae bacterium]|nr:CehA/McbA family metallohydrolase [Saprospiraceae bacterium]